MKVQSYKDLDVWKKGIDIVDLAYDLTAHFPNYEKFGLATQMQRAAISIPSNIAEGFARRHTKEYRQFCHISLGSCSELETQLIITRRRDYGSSESIARLELLFDHESRMLMNLIKHLNQR